LPAAPIALDEGFAGIHHFHFSPCALYINLLMSSSSPAAGNQRPQSTFHRGLQETTDRYVCDYVCSKGILILDLL
tara:strand:- start:2356 stop:2580 length:225 start_codon:yes stop_codon:yes gene_type:complete